MCLIIIIFIIKLYIYSFDKTSPDFRTFLGCTLRIAIQYDDTALYEYITSNCDMAHVDHESAVWILQNMDKINPQLNLQPIEAFLHSICNDTNIPLNHMCEGVKRTTSDGKNVIGMVDCHFIMSLCLYFRYPN
jgi:hypothetical protein